MSKKGHGPDSVRNLQTQLSKEDGEILAELRQRRKPAHSHETSRPVNLWALYGAAGAVALATFVAPPVLADVLYGGTAAKIAALNEGYVDPQLVSVRHFGTEILCPGGGVVYGVAAEIPPDYDRVMVFFCKNVLENEAHIVPRG